MEPILNSLAAIELGPDLEDLVQAASPSTMRVERDGLSVVHEGELIVPVAGAEARLEPLRSASTVEVPIEIEITVGISAAEREDIIQEALRRLRIAIETSGG